MQIVIDIPYEDYKELTKTGENEICLGLLLDLREAVRNGTILPEGHGRLIDADALEEKIERHFGERRIEMYDRDLLLHYTDEEMAPAIIEAEKRNRNDV